MFPALSQSGSSPLARGTPKLVHAAELRTRLIPARAGNTGERRPFTSWLTAHPRSRGEHEKSQSFHYFVSGSSPLARGTHLKDAEAATGARLIPARAGNTSWRARGLQRIPAHPRSRGEHSGISSSSISRAGSSPLARGTRRLRGTARLYRRLIPARAGNTDILSTSQLRNKAHPRSRGEHAVNLLIGAWLIGSSPLARGTPSHGRKCHAVHRLIPARAGNTSTCRASWGLQAAHPRSRGEHFYWVGREGLEFGSSPLARGTHQLQRRERHEVRLIPARAGNTRTVSRAS